MARKHSTEILHVLKSRLRVLPGDKVQLKRPWSDGTKSVVLPGSRPFPWLPHGRQERPVRKDVCRRGPRVACHVIKVNLRRLADAGAREPAERSRPVGRWAIRGT